MTCFGRLVYQVVVFLTIFDHLSLPVHSTLKGQTWVDGCSGRAWHVHINVGFKGTKLEKIYPHYHLLV